ncbi:MAG: DUF1307 domain-containing protein, partial [Ruminococcus sp.]|nr:DUF1307 domain-containing protein [Ruminococcus sp.]
CGNSEPTTVTLTMEQNGATIDYKLDAKGDVVQTITQTSTVDCSAYTEEQLAVIEESAGQYAASYEGIEGVTYSIETVDTNLVETIVIDATNSDSLQELSDLGLLPIEGSSSSISLEKTVENLEALGMTVVE